MIACSVFEAMYLIMTLEAYHGANVSFLYILGCILFKNIVTWMHYSFYTCCVFTPYITSM